MSIPHNKRRNTGLMYEFLLKTIAQGLVEGNEKKSSLALKILKRHFKQGTQLYKELRLINALTRTTISSPQVAFSVLKEAKRAASNYDFEKLNKEKSLLIKHVNYSLKEYGFYDHHVNDYKIIATAQSLLNQWRTPDGKRDISEIAKYEDSLVNWLITEKHESSESEIINNEMSKGSSSLLLNVMTTKINDKYSEHLNEQQKELIKDYAFFNLDEKNGEIKRTLKKIQEETVKSIDNFVLVNFENEYITKKLNAAKDLILSENIDIVDDNTITRFLTYERLGSEINSKD